MSLRAKRKVLQADRLSPEDLKEDRNWSLAAKTLLKPRCCPMLCGTMLNGRRDNWRKSPLYSLTPTGQFSVISRNCKFAS
jgi:hypothetical protein